MKKTSMPNSVESLKYIKCYSSSSPRPVKSPSSLIRHNCQKIWSWLRRPKTILEIIKKTTFLEVIDKPIIYKFFKDFTNHRKKTILAVDLYPTLLNTRSTNETFQQSGKQDSFRHVLKSLNFTLDSEDLLYWCKQKKWFLWTMTAAQATKNHEDDWSLTWYLRWGIYTSVPTWTHSQNSLVGAFVFNISQMIRKTIPTSRIIVTSHAMKRDILFWVYQKVNENWDNNTIRISQWRESHCGTNTNIWKDK